MMTKKKHIKNGIEQLKVLDKTLLYSSTFKSKSVGFNGADFLNMIVIIQTDLQLPELQLTLKKIELKSGIFANTKGNRNKFLDIDIVCFGNWSGIYHGIRLPRAEVFFNAHVLGPLSEVLPNHIIPSQNKTALELWDNYSEKSKITRI